MLKSIINYYAGGVTRIIMKSIGAEERLLSANKAKLPKY